MIKFFRNIRQNQIMENKTGKYFKYAIGEIILVVIGILIALSINNWNEKRQNAKTLSIYTNQLIEEVEINIAKLDTVIIEESKLKTHMDTVVQLLNAKDYDNLKLIQKSYALLSFEAFDPETITFDNLKSSGEFKLINNIDLRNAISRAYNSFEQVQLTQEVHYFNMKTRIADYFLEHANYSDMMNPTPNFGKGIIFANLTLSANATITQKINACQSSLKEMKQLKERLIIFRSAE